MIERANKLFAYVAPDDGHIILARHLGPEKYAVEHTILEVDPLTCDESARRPFTITRSSCPG